jgi:hypothetical protein
MRAIHVLKLPHVMVTIKVFEAEDVLEIVGRYFGEWDEADALTEWWLSVLDLYADDPRRIEGPPWEKVDTYAKLFVSPCHVLWHAKPNVTI